MHRVRAKLFLFIIGWALLSPSAFGLPAAKKQLPAVALAPISTLHPGHDLNLNEAIDSTHSRTTRLSHRLRTKLHGRSLNLTRRNVHIRHNASLAPAKPAKIKTTTHRTSSQSPGPTANMQVLLLPRGH